jgi:hypothetical protein
MRHAPTTAGLTLTEMLVATIVFLVGFVAVFGLFLGGMRFRKLSEDTTRSALAASCIIEEIRLDSGGSAVPNPPDAYVGCGFTGAQASPNNDPMPGSGGAANLFAYPASPGIWYRVLSAKSLDPTNPANIANDKSTVLEMRLLVMPYSLAGGDASVQLSEVTKRLGVTTALTKSISTATVDEIAQELVNRGLAISTDAVITRRPSWLP